VYQDATSGRNKWPMSCVSNERGDGTWFKTVTNGVGYFRPTHFDRI